MRDFFLRVTCVFLSLLNKPDFFIGSGHLYDYFYKVCLQDMFSKQPFPPCKVKWSTHKLYLMIIQNKASLTFGLLARNRLTDSSSFSNLITETRTLFALLDVLLYLSANGLKHPHCLPDVGIWSRVLKRLQVDGDSLRLGDDLSVVVVFRKFVRPFGDLEDSFLAVQVIKSVHCNRLFVPRANNMIKIKSDYFDLLSRKRFGTNLHFWRFCTHARLEYNFTCLTSPSPDIQY